MVPIRRGRLRCCWALTLCAIAFCPTTVRADEPEAGNLTGFSGETLGAKSQVAQVTIGSARVDALITDFMHEHGIPGIGFALARNGNIVYCRGYGYADCDTHDAVTSQSLFRIASLSKPITAVAVLRLVEQGKVALDARLLEVLDFEPEIEAAGEAFDPRWRQITIRHLLQHRGGWDRSESFDPMFRPVRFAKKYGMEPPAGPQTIIKAMLARELDFAPGERYAYSNFGYCLLGRVIERLSGTSYEAYVRSDVLAPLGITQMKLGRTRLEDRAPDEVRYYACEKGPSVFARDLGCEVPRPYGCWCLEAMDAHGGWLASAEELAKFAIAFDVPDKCPILSPKSIGLMHERPEGLAGYEADGTEKAIYYSLGWLNRALPDGQVHHWHTGSLDGTETILIRRHDGWSMVALLNTRSSPKTEQLSLAVDQLMHQAAAAFPDAAKD